eukprot:m.62952 g.62952  ORF g.62952 m.62952 type:complete len:321 (-) comp23219_c0_seq2:218-1180(-)
MATSSRKRTVQNKSAGSAFGFLNHSFSTPQIFGLGAVAFMTVYLFIGVILPQTNTELNSPEETVTTAKKSGGGGGKRVVAGFKLLETTPHEISSFTQGLLVYGDILIESTGYYGHSHVFKINATTGNAVQSLKLEDKYFGEGITLIDDKIVMLTWKEKTGFIIDIESLEIERTFEFSTSRDEGWGIAYDGNQLLVTDGSHHLHFWDPQTMKETRRVVVRYKDGSAQDRLNELEYIPSIGLVLANVWYKDFIVAINLETGIIEKTFDFQRLKKKSENHPKQDCFNGIALNESNGEMYLTGKWWKHMYRLDFSSFALAGKRV